MIKSHVLGYPRIGENRELKFALEQYWKGGIDADSLEDVAAQIRSRNWQQQRDQGLSFITVGDFSLYDHVADHVTLFGCQPARFDSLAEQSPLDQYFALCRGKALPPLDMTKWFDTNYHYMVPELDDSTQFSLHPNGLLSQVKQAKAFGHPIKVVVLGPVSFLRLSAWGGRGEILSQLMDKLLPHYVSLFAQLKALGVQWVQLDEPVLALDTEPVVLAHLEKALHQLKAVDLPILLATYFSSLNGHISAVCKMPIDGLHLDVVRAPEDLSMVLDWLPNFKVLSLGVVDGRNIWKTDLDRALSILKSAFDAGRGEVWVASSCSLLHVPYQLTQDEGVKPEVRCLLAGAQEKICEIAVLAQATLAWLNGNPDSLTVSEFMAEQRACRISRKVIAGRYPEVRERVRSIEESECKRLSEFAIRAKKQHQALNLPAFPTTTIGSFPQTDPLRRSRAAFRRGELDTAEYEAILCTEIKKAIEIQERLGLDVLVHGEAERNDMVEFFGQQLEGFAFSENGWVQSYGSRCVKPPILYGDVKRTGELTVSTAVYAQSLSEKPVKGMLTGPITLLQWSFVRDDQPRRDTAFQLALAVREEVQDLQEAGIQIIQIDEPAFREGLPLKRKDWPEYLAWAARAFRFSASVAYDETQIHTHMCYSEFNDIMDSIAQMDADVITIETSRSNMELLKAFERFQYPNQIGPGVYDIHSPIIPQVELMKERLRKAAGCIDPDKLWVNPDCGLKTRNWEEVEQALGNMVQAALALRDEYA